MPATIVESQYLLPVLEYSTGSVRDAALSNSVPVAALPYKLRASGKPGRSEVVTVVRGNVASWAYFSLAAAILVLVPYFTVL